MKTTSLILALALGFLIFPAISSAQVPYIGQIQYGVKAGINAAWLTEDLRDNEPRLGIGAGLALRYNVSPSLAIQGEAQYSQKGEQFVTSGGREGTVQLDYIEIPVLARYAVPLSPLMTSGIYAGPSIGIPINSKEKIADDPRDIENASTDFGLNVGVDIGSGPFSVDGRFNFGLTDICEGCDSKNQNVQFTFGYWF